jgi:hypothetical protein
MKQQMLMTADELSAEVARCIEQCVACHRMCLATFMRQVLEESREHADPDQLRMLLACAHLCRATADLMLILVAPPESVCAACAQLCRECAATYREQQAEEELVATCLLCAQRCSRLAGPIVGNSASD